MLFLSMLLMGGIIGFVGAGGSGVIITLLVVGFGVPIHQALAVAPTKPIIPPMRSIDTKSMPAPPPFSHYDRKQKRSRKRLLSISMVTPMGFEPMNPP